MSNGSTSHFRRLSLLGRGGMGEVHLAEDTRVGRRVALKILAASLADDAGALRRFESEARAAATLSHPNIATLFDLGADAGDGRPYLVFEYVEGDTLRARLDTGPMNPDDAMRALRGIAEALAHAHAHGVVHRDLKPGNVMLDRSGQAKLLDFGLALIEDSTRVTRDGRAAGTLAYMSPEQLRGGQLGPATDIWSFGVCAYELLTGEHPFRRDSGAALSTEDTVEFNASVPAELRPVLERCLRPTPEDRFTDGRALLDALEAINTTVPSDATASRSRKPLWVATGGMVLLALAFVIFGPSVRGGVPFTARDFLLLAAFENRTNDAAFDGSLDAAFAVSLKQSRYANVLPSSRARGALERMELPPETPILGEVAREIAIREGVAVIVAGSITQIGDAYALSADILEPKTDVALRSVSSRADGRDDVLAALDRLADALREQLGESIASIEEARVPLPLATTSSIDALVEFAEGEKAMGALRYVDARNHFQAAVDRDSTFALALARLGASHYWGGNEALGEESFERALALRERLTERERRFLTPMIDAWRRHRESAVSGFRNYLDFYPDDTSAWHSLGYQYSQLERCDEAAEAFRHVKAGEPSVHINLGVCYGNTGRLEEAVAEYEEAFRLNPEWRTGSNLNHEYGFMLIPLGRIDEARDVFGLMLDKGNTERARGLRSLGLLDCYEGRFRAGTARFEEAALLTQRTDSPLSEARNRQFAAKAYRFAGDLKGWTREMEAALQILEEHYYGATWVLRCALELLEEDRIDEARRLHALAEERHSPDVGQDRATLHLFRGILLLRDGEISAAQEEFEQAAVHIDGAMVWIAQADAHRQSGERDAARALYQTTADVETFGWERLFTKLMAHVALGEMAEEDGELREALEHYQDLIGLWSGSDERFPLREDLEARVERIERSLAG